MARGRVGILAEDDDARVFGLGVFKRGKAERFWGQNIAGVGLKRLFDFGPCVGEEGQVRPCPEPVEGAVCPPPPAASPPEDISGPMILPGVVMVSKRLRRCPGG